MRFLNNYFNGFHARQTRQLRMTIKNSVTIRLKPHSDEMYKDIKQQMIGL